MYDKEQVSIKIIDSYRNHKEVTSWWAGRNTINNDKIVLDDAYLNVKNL